VYAWESIYTRRIWPSVVRQKGPGKEKEGLKKMDVRRKLLQQSHDCQLMPRWNFRQAPPHTRFTCSRASWNSSAHEKLKYSGGSRYDPSIISARHYTCAICLPIQWDKEKACQLRSRSRKITPVSSQSLRSLLLAAWRLLHREWCMASLLIIDGKMTGPLPFCLIVIILKLFLSILGIVWLPLDCLPILGIWWLAVVC
jgi:hypothetical protein